MSRADVLAMGREAAQAGMIDACLIQRVIGTTDDPDTGVTTPTYATIYTGSCRIQEVMAFARDTFPSPSDPALMRYRVLQLPVATSEGIRHGDLVTITACVNDPDLVGLTSVVRDQSGKSEATSRRIGIEELT